MKRLSSAILALAVALGGSEAQAQNTPQTQQPQPQQRPQSGQPQGGARQGGPGGPGGARPGGAAGMAQQQGPNGQVRGAVIDAATGRPIANASVAVRSAADSSLVTGALTRADGSFRVQGLRPGNYYLRVAHMGHETTLRGGITLTAEALQANVGVMRLAAAALAVEGVTATAERATVQMSADRNTYSTRDMPAASGGNATDVLRNVPAVEVDQDGRVSLRGNQNVAVQINGRAAPMRGDQLGQFLQQLPANVVERVEVIPNPSARYDPEGMAGIVNIVLKQGTDLGLSGGLTASAGTGDRYNGSGNLGYQSGPWTLFGNLGVFDDRRRANGFSNRTELGASGITGYTLQDMSGDQHMQSLSFNGNIEYKLGRAESLAGSLMASRREMGIDAWTAVARRDAANTPMAGYDNQQLTENQDRSFDGTLSFRRLVQPRQNESTIELRYNRSHFDMSTAFATFAQDAGGNRLPGAPAQNRNLTDGLNQDMYLQADFTRMLSGIRTEFGYKGQQRSVDNDLTYQAFQGGAWADTANRVFGVDEQVHAGYLVLTRGRGPLELQGGIRLERTDRETTQDGDLGGFTNYFPSALVSYNLSQATQVKASYSKRIQRPQTQMLNSFYFNEGPLQRFHGNPNLRPEYTDAYELGYQQSTGWGSIQLTPFYRHTIGAIRRTPGVIEVVGGDSILTSTVENVATSNSYGADVNVSLRKSWLTGFVGMNAFQQESDGSTAAGAVSSSGFGWSARANANIRISPRTDFQLFGMYRAPMNLEFGRTRPMSMANVSLRQKFMNDKASVTLRVADPLNRMRFGMFQERDYDAALQQPGYEVDMERRFGARALFISFNYTFGQTPRIRAPRPQEQAPADPSQTGVPTP